MEGICIEGIRNMCLEKYLLILKYRINIVKMLVCIGFVIEGVRYG